MFSTLLDAAANQVVCTVVGGICTYLYAIVQKKKEELAAKDEIINKLVENDQAQLRQDIINTYYVWQDRGYMPVMVKDSLYKCFERYEASGGNSFVHEVIDKVKEMPTEVSNG